MFGSAQMSIIPAKVAGVKHITACTPPVKGQGWYPATINAMLKAGADIICVVGGVPAMAYETSGAKRPVGAIRTRTTSGVTKPTCTRAPLDKVRSAPSADGTVCTTAPTVRGAAWA